jgi:hypothetical protein
MHNTNELQAILNERMAETDEYYFTDEDGFLWYANEHTGEYYNTKEKE